MTPRRLLSIMYGRGSDEDPRCDVRRISESDPNASNCSDISYSNYAYGYGERHPSIPWPLTSPEVASRSIRVPRQSVSGFSRIRAQCTRYFFKLLSFFFSSDRCYYALATCSRVRERKTTRNTRRASLDSFRFEPALTTRSLAQFVKRRDVRARTPFHARHPRVCMRIPTFISSRVYTVFFFI